MSILVRAIERQIDNERRAFAKSRAVPADTAAVHLDDRFANGQTEAEAFLVRINLLKGIEDFVEKLRLDSDAGVADLDGDGLRRWVASAQKLCRDPA